MKSGFVSFIGRPNAGKSTLLNNIIGRKVAITSNKPQTTRNLIQGIYNDDDSQIIFVDTPGIHKPKHKLGKVLNKQAYFTIDDADVILYVVDACEKIGNGDRFVIEVLEKTDKPVILLLNKIDKLTHEEILVKISEYKDLYNFSDIIPVCALKNESIKYLLKVLKTYLKDNIKYFDDDTVTNVDLSFLISEYIREKVLNYTHEEVPHAITCITNSIEKAENNISISATIIVDRENLKKIIIGKSGTMLKKIGTSARHDIEALLGEKVYLDLFVKVVKDWRDKEKFLNEIGFKDFNE